MGLKVKEVAELAQISVRTLHHYDEIGLLTPDQTTSAGYRLYSDENLEMLQQILFFRELGLPLKQIKQLIHDPSFDRLEALNMHKKVLLQKRNRIDQMLQTIDQTVRHLKGEITMSNKEKFAGFDFSHNPYEQEARDRWGEEAVDKSNAYINSKSKEEMKKLQDDMSEIYRKLASVRHEKPDKPEAQSAIHEWYEMLKSFGSYPPEAFKSLGQMYVDDERFTKNIDQFGEGLAVFMRDAMAVYADNMEKK